MALERRRGTSRRYCYRSIREGQKIKKLYFGVEGTLGAISAQMMVWEGDRDRSDQRQRVRDLRRLRRSLQSLIAECRSLTRGTLILAGYDAVDCRRYSGHPGRPGKRGMTLRERHAALLRSVRTDVACGLAATVIHELAEFRKEVDDELRQQLCRELMAEAQEIAGDDPLPAESILAVSVILCREWVEIGELLGNLPKRSRPNSWENGESCSPPEKLLQRLRQRLERRA